jgi:hypothetical protein
MLAAVAADIHSAQTGPAPVGFRSPSGLHNVCGLVNDLPSPRRGPWPWVNGKPEPVALPPKHGRDLRQLRRAASGA